MPAGTAERATGSTPLPLSHLRSRRSNSSRRSRAHRHELERRRAQEKYRGLLRTVVRAWREEADGRKAKTLRSVALRPGVEHSDLYPQRMRGFGTRAKGPPVLGSG